MKILKTIMEQKGMPIPKVPFVWVLTREVGHYSDYTMSVVSVHIDKTEIDKEIEEYNLFIDAFRDAGIYYDNKNEMKEFFFKNPVPRLIRRLKVAKKDFSDEILYEIPRYRLIKTKISE